LFFFILSGFSAETTSVDKLRREIETIENRLKEIEEGRKGVVSQLQELDRKIELRRRLIVELEGMVKISSNRVKLLNNRIDQLDVQVLQVSIELEKRELDLEKLKDEVGNRMAFLYRRLSSREVSVLFMATSTSDLFQRKKYLKAVENFDRAHIEQLIKSRNEVEENQRELESFQLELFSEQENRLKELERVRNLLTERRGEEKHLTGERLEKTELLDRITGDTELVGVLLEERRRSLLGIENEIKSLEREPVVEITNFAPEIEFSSLSGKLSWPLKNRSILRPFGSIHDKKLKTVIDNPGIDISASPGDPVFAVAYGKVTRISYLRGFGNTMIVSHGGGYRTVYARLGKIFVQEGKILQSGQKIGEVGDAGTSNSLHFELWARRDKKNPLIWLSKS